MNLSSFFLCLSLLIKKLIPAFGDFIHETTSLEPLKEHVTTEMAINETTEKILGFEPYNINVNNNNNTEIFEYNPFCYPNKHPHKLYSLSENEVAKEYMKNFLPQRCPNGIQKVYNELIDLVYNATDLPGEQEKEKIKGIFNNFADILKMNKENGFYNFRCIVALFHSSIIYKKCNNEQNPEIKNAYYVLIEESIQKFLCDIKYLNSNLEKLKENIWRAEIEDKNSPYAYTKHKVNTTKTFLSYQKGYSDNPALIPTPEKEIICADHTKEDEEEDFYYIYKNIFSYDSYVLPRNTKRYRSRKTSFKNKKKHRKLNNRRKAKKKEPKKNKMANIPSMTEKIMEMPQPQMKHKTKKSLLHDDNNMKKMIRKKSQKKQHLNHRPWIKVQSKKRKKCKKDHPSQDNSLKQKIRQDGHNNHQMQQEETAISGKFCQRKN